MKFAVHRNENLSNISKICISFGHQSTRIESIELENYDGVSFAGLGHSIKCHTYLLHGKSDFDGCGGIFFHNFNIGRFMFLFGDHRLAATAIF